MNKIIKVDRVCSLDEAIMLEKLGVNIIGVFAKKSSLFADDREFGINQIYDLKKALNKAKLCFNISDSDISHAQCIPLIKSLGVDYVQIQGNNLPPREFRNALKQMAIGIIYSQISMSYDDDPSWIVSHFDQIQDLNEAYFQLELLTDITNSWHFLKNECPQKPDEFQIEDIENLAYQYPCLITLDFNCHNIREIDLRFKNIKGFNFTLGKLLPPKYHLHTIEFNELTQVLKLLQKVLV